MSLKEWQYKADFKDMNYTKRLVNSLGSVRKLHERLVGARSRATIGYACKGNMKLTGKIRLWRYSRKAKRIVPN